MVRESETLEKDAYLSLSQNRFEEAFKLFKKAGEAHKSSGNHKQAALCFASAASCWGKKYGERTFFNAALSYENAAKEAEISGDLEYASVMYKHAAINHEMDAEFFNFSDCFYKSKECYRRFLIRGFMSPGKIDPIMKIDEYSGIYGVIKRAFLLIMLTFSFLVWGHGERPSRTLITGFAVIILSAFFYTFGVFTGVESRVSPDFFEALYASIITFATVGYGDLTPVGPIRVIAMIEALSGVIVSSLFIVGISRKYLRI